MSDFSRWHGHVGCLSARQRRRDTESVPSTIGSAATVTTPTTGKATGQGSHDPCNCDSKRDVVRADRVSYTVGWKQLVDGSQTAAAGSTASANIASSNNVNATRLVYRLVATRLNASLDVMPLHHSSRRTNTLQMQLTLAGSGFAHSYRVNRGSVRDGESASRSDGIGQFDTRHGSNGRPFSVFTGDTSDNLPPPSRSPRRATQVSQPVLLSPSVDSSQSDESGLNPA